MIKKENPQKPRKKEWEIVYYLFIDDPLKMFVLNVNVHLCTYIHKDT